MAVPLVLMAAGTALRVFGQYRANMDQSRQEFQNAAFYQEQAEFAREASFRQANIAAREYEFRKGAQISAYARGGVDISGSAAGNIADTLAEKIGELNAIQRKGEIESKLALARARQSQRQGELLQDFGYNLTQAGGTILTNFAAASDNGSSPELFGGFGKLFNKKGET